MSRRDEILAELRSILARFDDFIERASLGRNTDEILTRARALTKRHAELMAELDELGEH
jgi:hypothetical protein